MYIFISRVLLMLILCVCVFIISFNIYVDCVLKLLCGLIVSYMLDLFYIPVISIGLHKKIISYIF